MRKKITQALAMYKLPSKKPRSEMNETGSSVRNKTLKQGVRFGLSHRAIACALGFLGSMQGFHAASAEGLKEALAAAYLSNPEIEAQRAALRATDEGVRRAKSNFLPSVTANYRRSEAEQRNQQFRNGVEVPQTDADGNPVPAQYQSRPQESYGINAQQNLFRGFRTRNEILQAKAEVDIGRAQLQQVEQQILLNGVAAYMDVVRDEAVHRLRTNNVQVLERQLQASRDRFRVGEITRTDVAQSEARLEVAKAQLLTAEAQLATSKAAYERVIGRQPVDLKTPDAAVPHIPSALDAALESALERAPGIHMARFAEEAARKGIHVAEGALLPVVTLEAQYSNFSGTNFFGTIRQDNQTDTRQVALNVQIPLYLGGANHSDIRRAKEIRSQRMVQIRQAERLAQENLLTSWNQSRAAKGQIISREAAVKANEIALEGVRQEAAVGSRTTLDVLDAEQELLDSRVSLVMAERDATVAAYSLLAAMGQLTSRDLDLDVESYAPEAHYSDVHNKIVGW